MEDRIVPAGVTYYWTGGGTTNNASEAANWIDPQTLNQQVPQNGDIAIIDGGAQGLGINAGKPVNFDAAFNSQLGQLQILQGYGGNVTVSTNMTVTDSITEQTSSVLVTAGSTVTTSVYTISGSMLLGAAGTIAIQGGNFSITGPQTTIGISAITVDAASTFNVYATVTFQGCAVTLNGKGVWTAGNIALFGGATITSNNSFEVDGNNTMRGSPAGGFINKGSFIKQQSADETEIRARFESPAGSQIQVQTGTLDYTRGRGTIAAQVQVSAGAVMEFDNSVNAITLKNPVVFLGGGKVQVDLSATLTVDGTVDFWTSLKTSGKFDGGSQSIVNSWTSLEWLDGEFADFLEINVYNTMLVDGDTVQLTSSSLYQYGTATWSGIGDINLLDSNFYNIRTFQIQNSGTSVTDQAASRFDNEATGTLTKLAGNNNYFNIPFQTEGTVLLNAMRIDFCQGYTQDEDTSVTDTGGGTLGLKSPPLQQPPTTETYTLEAGTMQGGGMVDGNLDNNGGTVQLGSAVQGGSLQVTGNFSQEADGTLVDTSPNNLLGVLFVNNTADLGGSLAVSIGGPQPPPGTNFLIVTAANITGQLSVSGNFIVIVNNTMLMIQQS
jgi:hypothetical protein